MITKVAAEAGFCFGVKRALQLISELQGAEKPVTTYGPLIHNEAVLADLRRQGVTLTRSLDQVERGRTLITRTHGTSRSDEERLLAERIDHVDATCPLVKKSHRIITELAGRGLPLVIVGDRSHPEIEALCSHAPGAVVINSEQEARELPRYAALAVVAQTTLNTSFFHRVVSILVDRSERLEVFNTVCQATRVRQQAVRDLAPTVDFVVVIGGRNSSNTNKLVDIAREQNPRTYHFETAGELDDPLFLAEVGGFASVGITGGASTPPEEIDKARAFFAHVNTAKGD